MSAASMPRRSCSDIFNSWASFISLRTVEHWQMSVLGLHICLRSDVLYKDGSGGVILTVCATIQLCALVPEPTTEHIFEPAAKFWGCEVKNGALVKNYIRRGDTGVVKSSGFEGWTGLKVNVQVRRLNRNTQVPPHTTPNQAYLKFGLNKNLHLTAPPHFHRMHHCTYIPHSEKKCNANAMLNTFRKHALPVRQ